MAVHDTFVRVVMELSAARDLRSVMATVRGAARELTGADGATFVLREGDLCHYADEDAIGPLWKGRRFPLESCISGWAMKHKQPAVVEDIYADPRIPLSAYEPTFVRSLVMVPVRAADPIAAIGIYWAERRRATDDEVRLVQALADSTAVALENVRALDEARRWRALLEEASDTIWTMDPSTGIGEMRGVGRWWASLTGRPAETYRDGDAWLDDLHPADRAAVTTAWTASLRAPVNLRTQYRVKAHDGSFRHVAARAVAVTRPDGTHELVGMISDVTGEREAERTVQSLLDRERLARKALDEILERVADGFVAIDRDWRYTYANKRASELLGRNIEELIGHRVWTVFPEAVGGPFYLAMERARATHEAVFEEAFLPSWNRWFENRIYASETGCSIFFTDVTEARRAEEALEEARLRLELAIRASNVGFWEWDAGSLEWRSTDECKRQLGYEAHEMEDSLESWQSRLHPEDRDEVLRQFAAQASGPAEAFQQEIRLRHRDGTYRWVLWRASIAPPIRGNTSRVRGCQVDVTESHEAREELRQLSRRLLTAQDEERRRISRDLHDDLAQVLTAVKMSLTALSPGMEPGAFEASVRSAIEIVDRSIRQTRDLSLQLHPPMLDVLGLGPTLRWHLGERLRGPSPVAHVSIELRHARFPTEIENACFRVSQEAITNVLRHAQARQIWFHLREEAHALVMIVQDDGCGFQPGTTRARAGSEKCAGLAGMQERVALAGGTFDLSSTPGKGTAVSVRFALEARS